jgi:hypothetical protein
MYPPSITHANLHPFYERVKHFLFVFSLFSLCLEKGMMTLLATPALARRVALFELFVVYREDRKKPLVGRNNPSPEDALKS